MAAQPWGISLVYQSSSSVQCVQQAAKWKVFLDSSTVQKHFIYILQLAVHTVQRIWICRLGRYLMDYEFYKEKFMTDITEYSLPINTPLSW